MSILIFGIAVGIIFTALLVVAFLAGYEAGQVNREGGKK